SDRLRAELPRYHAQAALRARVLAQLQQTSADSEPSKWIGQRWRWLATGAAAGCAATVIIWLAASTFMAWRTSEDLATEVVNAHVHATLSNHLIEVASSDRHTVKPWLSARLDYAPPVPDLADEG